QLDVQTRQLAQLHHGLLSTPEAYRPRACPITTRRERMRSFPRMGNSRLRVGTLAALLSASCLSASAQDEDQLVTRIQQATVLLVPPVCAGVLVGEGDWVLTAAHCVHSPGSALP